jgi:hypothetical protein
MKKYLLLISVILFIVYGCQKKADVVNPAPIAPGVSVKSISLPLLADSKWSNIAGGMAVFRFDLLDATGAVASSTKDSVTVKDIGGYNKILTKGTYNIYVSCDDQKSVADTFMRFNAEIKSFVADGKQALVITPTTTDGMISIAQSFIQPGTVPTFTTDSASQTFNLSLANGYYYLYVKGGTTGKISFVSTTGQTVTKNLSVVTSQQSNMAVQINKGSLQVVFVPFTDTQIAVSSSTLVNMNLTPDAYTLYSTVYFVATDESGNILNEVKYIQGTSKFKISALQPFTKDRFNLFEIYIPNDPNTVPGIIGFLQVKKGSTFTSNLPYLPSNPYSIVSFHLNSGATFDHLNVSTNSVGSSLNSPSDSTSLHGIPVTSGSPVWVQMLKNNQYFYNFFNITPGTTNYNIDLNQLTKTPLVQNITAPGNNLQVIVTAKNDTAHFDTYNLGSAYSQYNQVSLYYPSEPFAEYDVIMDYTIGSLYYRILSKGTSIPAQAAAFNASFTISGSSLADFVPSLSGTYDYYYANFQNTAAGSNISIDLYSPSAGNYANIKLPDFSKYLGRPSLDLSTVKLKYFSLNQSDGFNERNFYYKNDFSVNSKSVSQSF